MSARKLGNSWWVDFRHCGVRYRKRSPQNSRGGARDYEETLRSALARGLDPCAPDASGRRPEQTMSEFAPEWMDGYSRANNKPSEQYTKHVLLRLHIQPFFGRMKLSAIGPECIETYKALKLKEGYAAKTVNNHLAVLGKILRTAVDWDRLDACPRYRQLKTIPPEMDYLTPLESHALVGDQAEPTWNAMTLVGARTGMRKGELRALAWSDVDFEHRHITVRRSAWRNVVASTKTSKIRHVPMTDDVCETLLRMRESSGYVFHRPDGSIVAESTAEKAIARICKRTGVKITKWHGLRHTCGSQLSASGVPLNQVSAVLGHSSITTTMRYAHFAPSMLHESIKVLQEGERRAVLRNQGQPVGKFNADIGHPPGLA